MTLVSKRRDSPLAIRINRKDERRVTVVAKRFGLNPSTRARKVPLAQLERTAPSTKRG